MLIQTTVLITEQAILKLPPQSCVVLWSIAVWTSASTSILLQKMQESMWPGLDVCFDVWCNDSGFFEMCVWVHHPLFCSNVKGATLKSRPDSWMHKNLFVCAGWTTAQRKAQRRPILVKHLERTVWTLPWRQQLQARTSYEPLIITLRSTKQNSYGGLARSLWLLLQTQGAWRK